MQTLNSELEATEGLAVFGNDDGYIIGDPNILFSAVDQFTRAIKEHCDLEAQLTKTCCYHESGLLPPQAPEDMPRAGVMVTGECRDWFHSLSETHAGGEGDQA